MQLNYGLGRELCLPCPSFPQVGPGESSSDLGMQGAPHGWDRVVVWGRLFSVETWEGQTNEEVSREHAKHVGFPSPSKKG